MSRLPLGIALAALFAGETGVIDLNGCGGLGRLGGRVFDVVVGLRRAPLQLHHEG